MCTLTHGEDEKGNIKKKMSIDTDHYVTSECSRATVHSHTEVLMCLYCLYVLLNTAHQQVVPYFPDNTNCIVYYKRNKSVLKWLLKETNTISIIHHTAEDGHMLFD